MKWKFILGTYVRKPVAVISKATLKFRLVSPVAHPRSVGLIRPKGIAAAFRTQRVD